MSGDRTERVAAVLARLPVVADRRAAIPALARGIVDAYTLLKVGEAPRFRAAGTRKAARDLAKLQHHCAAAVDILRAMPSEAHAALDVARGLAEARRKVNEARGRARLRDRVPDHDLFVEALAAFAVAVKSARLALESDPTPTGNRKRANVAADGTARLAARAYKQLTGGRPTVVTAAAERGHRAGGAFLELVAALFDVLGEKAKPESYARTAVRSLGRAKTNR